MNFDAGVDSAPSWGFTAWITLGRVTFTFSFISVDGYMAKLSARTAPPKYDAETATDGLGYSCGRSDISPTPRTRPKQTDRADSAEAVPILRWHEGSEYK